MDPGTDDRVFLEGFHAVVPRLLKLQTGVVVTQLGVDPFWNDPLADLELTTNGFCEVVSFMVKHAPAWVALGGGGYSITNVARAWSLAWAIMNDIHLPDDLRNPWGVHFPQRRGRRRGCAMPNAKANGEFSAAST